MQVKAFARVLGEGVTRFRTILCIAAVGMLCCGPNGASAQSSGSEPATPLLITDAAQIFSLTPEQKVAPVRIRLEGRVDYYDPEFRMLWLEANDVGTYLLLSPLPPAMRTGQRVRLEGTLIPDRGLAAPDVKVTVLSESDPVVPLSANGRIGDMTALQSRIVTVDGYVDSQQYVDGSHIRLTLVIDDRPVIGWVVPLHPDAVPDWTGKFIRLEGLYSGRFDPTNTGTTIEIWSDEPRLSVRGSLADSPSFRTAPTPINEIYYHRPVGSQILVRGRVEAHTIGSLLTLRDDTGQVTVYSVQRERLPTGASVEAVGKVAVEGAQRVLRPALYRRAAPDWSSPSPPPAGTLTHVEQIRELSLAEAERQRPVRVLAMVTWSMPGSDFMFVQDLTGGIRVRYDPAKFETPRLGKYFEIDGVTGNGGFVPAVVLQHLIDRGSMSPPDPRPVTFEQAISGKEEGQWVEMRGFVQRTESDGNWRWIYVTTPGGEFVGHLQSPVDFAVNPGSLIRVHGVCESTLNAFGQLTGVMLRVPFIHDLTVDEDAPVDYYDLPRHTIKGLRQLSSLRDMTRVRVIGTVLHAAPGRYVYLQEDDTGLQVLTRSSEPLRPGDTVEAVGILGWEGPRLILREGVYRKKGSGTPPPPVFISDPARAAPPVDARLATVRGYLIDASRQSDHIRLTLQSGSTLFEATLDRTPGHEPEEPAIGAGLELTGIYQMIFDSARQTRGFALQLRTPADIVVFQQPRLWTVQRALIACGVLAGFVLLGVGWITALRRRVGRQTEQIRTQMERQAQLETEVQRAARLESLGALAGGIAHDFNNLLTIIIGNLGLAMLDTKISDATAHCLREIERGTSRARALTRQLLTFAKGGEPVRTLVELPEVVKGAADRALHESKLRCRYEIAPGLWHANVDKDQIAQVVHNLVVNAVQAMPPDGELCISLENEEVPAPGTTALAPGRYLKIAVVDTGEGIPAEVLPRVFDPYFTTRKSRSGLGLATVYSVVKRHEGNIEVASTRGRGTTVTLWLPAATVPRPAAAAVPKLFPVARGRNVRVLLMDDEASIQKIVTEVLARAGIATTTVSDGAAAVKEFERAAASGSRFDLLILDLTVPGGMGGREVMEHIRRLDSLVPAIVSSGYSNDPVMANFEQHGFQATVQKPYEINELVAVVERLLALGRPVAT